MIRRFGKADWSRLAGGMRQSMSGVAISAGFHIAILIVMALIVYTIPNQNFTPIELGWSTIVESANNEPVTEEVPTISIPVVSINNDNMSSKPPEARPADIPTNPTQPSPDAKPEVRLSDVSRSLSKRNSKSKSESESQAHGSGAKKGTGREAIELALKWIVRQQQSDGHWDLTGPYPDGGSIKTDTGATSLALLALLGDGNTHQAGPHQEAVAKGIQWLLKIQKPNGDLFDILEQGREPHFYAHSQGTIVLCEALALTGDSSLREPATRAVQFLIDAQNPELGGWKYRPLNADGIGDLSVTGWVLMALHSARMAEIEVPFDTFILASRFLDSVQEDPHNATKYKYRPDFPVAETQQHSMTAEGLLCRQWLGWPKNTPALRRGVTFLTSTANEPEWLPGRRNVYAWYYTAQTLHNMGGTEWEKWFSTVLPMLVKNQSSSGRSKGSWHPTRPNGAGQERSRDGGRLYFTVMCVLILETPDRHAPLYETLTDAP